MATEFLYGDTVGPNSNCETPENALGQSDGTWTTNQTGGTLTWTCRWIWEVPSANLEASGTQIFRVLARQSGGTGSEGIINSISLWEGGGFVTQFATDLIPTSEGTLYEFTVNSNPWSSAQPTDARIAIDVDNTGGGSPGSRQTVQVEYVEWEATTVASEGVNGDIAATLDGSSADIAATRFPAYWKKISGETTIQAGETQFHVVLQVDPDNNGGWWFDEVIATVNGGANQLTNGTFNTGDKTGWTGNVEQDGIVVDPEATYDPPGAFTLQIDADPSVVQQQSSDSFSVNEGDTVYVEAWVYFYGGVNANGKATGKAKNADDEVVRTVTVAETSPDSDVVTSELDATLESTSSSIAAVYGVTGDLAASLADTTADLAGTFGEQEVTGDISATLDNTTAALIADHLIAGDISATLDATTADLSATHGISGALAAPLDNTTAALTADHLIAGDISATLDATTADLSATHGISGALAAALDNTTATLAGDHESNVVTGDLSAGLDDTSAAITGTHGVTGSLSATTTVLADVVASHGITSSLNAGMEGTSAQMSGDTEDVTVIADLAAALDSVSLALSAEFYAEVTASLEAGLEDVQAVFGAEHFAPREGALDATLSGVTASATGRTGASAVLSVLLEAVAADLSQKPPSLGFANDPAAENVSGRPAADLVGPAAGAVSRTTVPAVVVEGGVIFAEVSEDLPVVDLSRNKSPAVEAGQGGE